MLLSVLEEAQTCHLRQRWATHEGPEHDDGILVNITSPNCSMFNFLKPYLILIFFCLSHTGVNESINNLHNKYLPKSTFFQ